MSGDLALRFVSKLLRFDLAIDRNDLATDEGLETALAVSLFTDAPARAGDALPVGLTDRRGWWGDEFAENPGDVAGSRLWLLDREKMTPDVLARSRIYAAEALEWLVTDKVAASVDVVVTFDRASASRSYAVTIRRPGGDVADYRFPKVWSAVK